MNWYIGQKVVCVNADGAERVDGTKSGLTKDKTYVITGIYKSCCNITITVGIVAQSSICICTCSRTFQCGYEWPFKSDRFRPLEDNFAEEVLSKALQEGIKLAKEIEA